MPHIYNYKYTIDICWSRWSQMAQVGKGNSFWAHLYICPVGSYVIWYFITVNIYAYGALKKEEKKEKEKNSQYRLKEAVDIAICLIIDTSIPLSKV